MDKLHTVLRSIGAETKGRDHLSVFREFLAHLDRIKRKAPVTSPSRRKAAPAKRRTGK